MNYFSFLEHNECQVQEAYCFMIRTFYKVLQHSKISSLTYERYSKHVHEFIHFNKKYSKNLFSKYIIYVVSEACLRVWFKGYP